MITTAPADLNLAFAGPELAVASSSLGCLDTETMPRTVGDSWWPRSPGTCPWKDAAGVSAHEQLSSSLPIPRPLLTPPVLSQLDLEDYARESAAEPPLTPSAYRPGEIFLKQSALPVLLGRPQQHGGPLQHQLQPQPQKLHACPAANAPDELKPSTVAKRGALAAQQLVASVRRPSPPALTVPPEFEPHPEPQPGRTEEPQQTILIRHSDEFNGSSDVGILPLSGPPPGLPLPVRPSSMPATPSGDVDMWQEMPPMPLSPLLLSPLLPLVSADKFSASRHAVSGMAPVAALGELPSLGSASHAQRKCKPCAFVHKSGCESGFGCKFCHLCPPGEKKIRKQERKERGRAAKQRLVMEQA